MATAKHVIVKIKVDLIVNAKNGLRRVVFGLEKDTDDNGTVKWEIHFKIFERDSKSVAYDEANPRIALDVEVDSKLNSKAETMAKQGLTVNQAAHVSGAAANAAIAANDGEIDEADAEATIQRTLKK